MENTKVEPKYMKTARRIAKATWDACKTKKSRAGRTRCVAKAFKEFGERVRSEAICMMMILKAGYGMTSPEFKCAKSRFDELLKDVERGYAIGNAWLEIANKENAK